MNVIKKWAKDDRPREKLLKNGRSVLTNTELLSIILGSGAKKKSAVDLAREIMEYVGRDLNRLSKLEVAELCNFKGVGVVKAINVIASIELGRRREFSGKVEVFRVKTSADVNDVMRSEFKDIEYEVFWVLCLSRANKILSKNKISEGGLDSTIVDPRRLFKIALMENASAMILCHNHPSGQLSPSQADIGLTEKICEAGKFMNVKVLDHIIFADSGYYSFADNGIMP